MLAARVATTLRRGSETADCDGSGRYRAVGRWHPVLASVFPHRDWWCAEVWEAACRAGVAVPPGRCDAGVMGRAVEHAMGLDAAVDPYRAWLRGVPVDVAQWVAGQR